LGKKKKQVDTQSLEKVCASGKRTICWRTETGGLKVKGNYCW